MCSFKWQSACVLGALLWHTAGAVGQCQTIVAARDAEPIEYFGWSVAVSADGRTAIMAALWDDEAASPRGGSAYVFVTHGGGWVQEAKLTASDAMPEDNFGQACALSADGNIAIIAARYADSKTVQDTGAAYVFRRTVSTWAEVAKLTTDDGASADRLSCVDLSADGETAVLGFRFDDDAGLSSGSAYVFVQRGSRWQQEAKLTANDAEAFDHFGESCAVSDDGRVVLIGADHDDNVFGSLVGAAYLYVNGATTGCPADLDGDEVVGITDFLALLSAWGTNPGRPPDLDGDGIVGITDILALFAAWGPCTGPSPWQFVQKLVPSDAMAFDLFGKSVALSADGTTAAVGATRSAGVDETTGATYIFLRERDGAVWVQQAKLFASDGRNSDEFGSSVALSTAGDTVLIGARFHDDPHSGSGSAYVFASGWLEETKLTPDNEGQWFGQSVALSADGAVRLVGAPASQGKDGGIAVGVAYIFNAATCEGE